MVFPLITIDCGHMAVCITSGAPPESGEGKSMMVRKWKGEEEAGGDNRTRLPKEI